MADAAVRWLLGAVATALLFPGLARAEFVGRLVLLPAGCEATGRCRIGGPFKYVDPARVEWLTTPPDMTDGASIPPWAQPFVGVPFTPAYVKAAVIHDHYCDRQVRPWRQTHRVFYDALIESGVDVVTAKILYYAVYVGGPKWVEVIPPKICPGTTGKSCIFNVPIPDVVDKRERMMPKTAVKLARPSQYDREKFQQELQSVSEEIKSKGGNVSLEELEEKAKSQHPDDFYYKNGDSVEMLMLNVK